MADAMMCAQQTMTSPIMGTVEYDAVAMTMTMTTSGIFPTDVTAGDDATVPIYDVAVAAAAGNVKQFNVMTSCDVDTDMSPADARSRSAVMVILTLLRTFLLACTLSGSVLTILAIRLHPKLKTRGNVILQSLAVADCLVGINFMVFSCLFFLTHLDGESCQLVIWTDVSNYGTGSYATLVSVLHMLGIALDRYIAVVHPLKYCSWMTFRRTYAMLAFFWIVPIPWSTGSFLWYHRWEGNSCTSPITHQSLMYVYTIPYCVFSVWLALAYGRIICVIRDTTKRLVGVRFQLSRPGSLVLLSWRTQLPQSDPSESTGDVTRNESDVISATSVRVCLTEDDRQGASLVRRATKSETKATRMLLPVVVAFVLLWLPYHVVLMLINGGVVVGGRSAKDNDTLNLLVNATITIGVCNSAINVFIYAVMNRDFRVAYAKIIVGRWRELQKKTFIGSIILSEK